MKKSLQQKLKELPLKPGVYFFYNQAGEIIYIGKASILKRRVASYFQKHHRDYKTPLLVENIANTSWIETDSEIEALFLEAEFIKRYKPLYNVLEKDDKNFIYVRITTNQDWPAVSFVRRPSDDRARYFGPFVHGYAVKKALRYLRRIFPYYVKPERNISSKLEHQIGVVPKPDMNKTEYRKLVKRLIYVLEGKTSQLLTQLEREMKKLAQDKRYEQAAEARNQYLALKALSTKIVFGTQEKFDLTLDQALNGLADRLGLMGAPRRIECYDISNFAGGDAVSSMIVFTDGVPNQSEYRHFKMHSVGPNDFAMMRETLRRRFSGRHDAWAKPDLVVIDGGKGQLSSALNAMQEVGVAIPTVGLAKRHEQIIQLASSATTGLQAGERIEGDYKIIALNHGSATLQLVQRIRDEAHRFAVSYHTAVRNQRTKTSQLDAIAGVGPATRKKLVKHFGSVAGIKAASRAELSGVVGPKLASTIKADLGTV
ncbi:excinuclease ABC subunit UvrC [Candidatus Saccharibacteria bacterium]|nr:excinuclease ABC subunit UvrC [Candidatus Saccharibacteria bacterium]